MKRNTLAVLLLLIFTIIVLGTVSPANSERGALPTNTRRPTLLMTNTRRPQSSPIPADTATLVPTNTLLPTETTVPTSIAIGPSQYPENTNPLTGLPYPNEEARKRRNVIVKVSNFPYIVRPQSGLSKADIVWEYEVEGGVTRFAAIFRSQGTEYVGPVRSMRLLDIELIATYNALFAYSGSNDKIKEIIRDADWKYQLMTPQFGDNCPPFCRFPKPGVPFEHTLFGNVYQMWDLGTRRNVNDGFAVRGMAFSDVPDAGGKVINDVFIKWYGDQNARWMYNPADHKYYRWNTGLPHIDAATGQQLTADNVLVLQAYHVDRPDIYESESGAKTIEIQLWGKEKAYLFRDGKWYQGIWVRRNRERSGLGIFYPDGQTPMKLKPGNTWIEVVRCCDMFGVDLSETYPDVLGTGTPAAATATARAPRLPTEALTQQAIIAEMTRTSSAATAQHGQRETITPVPLVPGSETPTPVTVGMDAP